MLVRVVKAAYIIFRLVPDSTITIIIKSFAILYQRSLLKMYVTKYTKRRGGGEVGNGDAPGMLCPRSKPLPTFDQKVSLPNRLSLKSLVAHYYRSLSRFPWYEVTRSIATPNGWDASPSQVAPQHFVRFS